MQSEDGEPLPPARYGVQGLDRAALRVRSGLVGNSRSGPHSRVKFSRTVRIPQYTAADTGASQRRMRRRTLLQSTPFGLVRFSPIALPQWWTGPCARPGAPRVRFIDLPLTCREEKQEPQ